VAKVHVVEGDNVAQGDVLVSLDDRDAQLVLQQREADVEQAEAKLIAEKNQHKTDKEALPREENLLSFAKKEVERFERLAKTQVVAVSALEQARQAYEKQAIAFATRQQALANHESRQKEADAAFTRAKALRDQAKIELSRMQVKAPFKARVAKIRVSPGQRLRTGDVIAEVYDLDALVARAQIPTSQLMNLRVAIANKQSITAKATVDGQAIMGRFKTLVGEVEQASGGLEALFTLEQGAAVLTQGRTIQLDVVLPHIAGVVVIPREGFYSGNRVFVMDAEQRMRAVDVTLLGSTQNDAGESRLIIQSPKLKAGDKLVTTQLPNAIDGLLLRTSEAQ
jgi:multidrug resistance efflux pump